MQVPAGDTDTRSAILAAAAELFASGGQSGTTIKQIGGQAGVNPALIYYYFDDKAALYDAVVSELMGSLPVRLLEAAAPAESPREALASVIRQQASLYLEQPLLPRLVLRELADHDGGRATPLLSEPARQLFGGMIGLIRRGQQEGLFRTDLQPHYAAISCLSQLNWYFVSRPLMQALMGGGDGARRSLAVEEFAEHVVQFTLAALEVR